MVAYPSGMTVWSPKIADASLVRKFVALNGLGYVAISVWDGNNNVAVDPDAGSISLTVWFNDVTLTTPSSSDPRGVQVIDTSSGITRTDLGQYYFDIGPQYTGNRGVLTAQWNYTVNGTPFTYLDYLQILDQMPLYETCSEQEKLLVEQVSWMTADCFDSTEGGPHLIEEFQTHFDYERIAELAQIATTRFNYIGQPSTNYTFGGNTCPGTFQGLLVIGTYIEVLRHLARSYVEIPGFPGTTVTYTDRRDYMQRWQEIFQSEWSDYQTSVKLAKRQLLQLGRGSLLLGGGYFGGGAGRSLFLFSPYNALTRAFRFYPAAPSISFPATRIP